MSHRTAHCSDMLPNAIHPFHWEEKCQHHGPISRLWSLTKYGRQIHHLSLMILCILLFSTSYTQACWLYDVTINGSVTFSGTPAAPPFSHRTLMVVTGPITSSSQTTNGVNPLDLGLFTYDPANPFLGVAGALYFATNTALSEAVIETAARGSAIDLAFVAWDPNTRTLSVALDEINARLGVLNIFNATTGVTAQVHNILAGTVELQFSDSFQSFSGAILLGAARALGAPL